MGLFDDYEALVRPFFDDLETRVAELEARIAELEAPAAGPTVIYETSFGSNDGWSSLDQRKNHDDSRTLPANVFFGWGGVILKAKREQTGSGTTLREFTSADIQGRHVTVPNYFRAEVRAQLPVAKGLRPCPLWFRPLNSNDGEIDIVEAFGDANYGKATLHSEYSNRKMIGKTLQWPRGKGQEYTYVIEKTPNRIHITIDGQTLMDVGPQTNPDFPWERIFETADRTWYPRISIEVGCGNNPGCSTGTPEASFTSADLWVRSLKISTVS